VGKTYQNEEIGTSWPVVPETVSVALGELAGELREGLLALAIGTGLQVMAALMEEDVTAACGPRGKHDRQRTATRHGTGRGSVTLGGRRVPVARPRMRATDGAGELAVPSYELFSSTEVLGRMAWSGCSRVCRRGATRSGSSRSAPAPSRPRRRR
jgi:putative transposase